MKILALDFETYYDKKEYSLSKMTTEAYIRDPRFEVIGVSVYSEDTEGPVWFSGDRTSVKAWLESIADWSETFLLAHNTAFDAAILSWRFGITPKGYLDTLSMANALYGINESVSLKRLAELLGLPAKGTEVHNADGKRRCDFTPEELRAYGEYCKLDTWLCHTAFRIMAPKFSVAELKLISMTIRMFAEPVLQLNKPLLDQHLIDVRDSQAESLQRLVSALGAGSTEEVKTILMSNPKFAQLLTYLGVDPPMKISPTTGKETYAFAKTDEAFTALLEHEDLTVQAAVAARLGNKTTIEESRTEAFIEIAERGAFPFPVKYSGAAVTHRWSGFDVNVQNLPRGGKLRGAITAPPGYKLVAADLSNIELRLGLWLAGQDDKVQLIRAGVDLYIQLATVIFGRPYEEVEALGKKSKERTTGKETNLASIYGVGAKKLRETLRVKGKVRFSLEETQRMTDIYRGDYDRVVAAWNEGKDVLDAIYHKQNYGPYLRGVINVTPEGMMKPSGLLLTYPDLQWTRDKEGKMGYIYEQKRKTRDRVYGSKCFQRCVQSLARDIIAEHMLKIDKKYRVVGTVHDEIICLVPDAQVVDAEKFMLEVMRTPPEWCIDKITGQALPLDAEVASGQNYSEAK